MEFLVNLEFKWRDGVDPAPIIDAERAAAAKLRQQGKLLRMWRVPCRNANWTLWNVSGTDELHEIFAGLPAFPYFEKLTVHPVARHPVDPGPDR